MNKNGPRNIDATEFSIAAKTATTNNSYLGNFLKYLSVINTAFTGESTA